MCLGHMLSKKKLRKNKAEQEQGGANIGVKLDKAQELARRGIETQ